MRRGSIVALLGIGLIAGGVATAVAVVPTWLPVDASREAGRIDFVFWFVIAICIAIFALVAAVIVYSLIKFRARPDDDADGPPVHGHTGLEIVWTAVPAILVTAISIVSAVVLARNDHLPQASAAGPKDPLKPLIVKVTAQQFAWLFTYPAYGNVTTSTLRLPLHVPVDLKLKSLDVIHSFWVPEFGQKQDAVPGLDTHVVVTPKRLGTFPVICTELCGLGHALMRSWTTVMPRADFVKWANAQKKATGGGASGGATAAGKTIFVNNGCNGCHTFKPAAANGTVGPDLDKLSEAAKKAGQPLDAFIRQSIVDPNAYIAPGYPKGVMPETFASLPKPQLDALVKFLSGGSK
jgi:cytochrome c oxidase subunit II